MNPLSDLPASQRDFNGFCTVQEAIESHEGWLHVSSGSPIGFYRNRELRLLNLRYADLKNENFQGTPQNYRLLCYADFRYADLRGADLRYTNLHGTNFDNADLTGANLEGALLLQSSLQFANLQRANCRNVDFFSADMTYANLTDAIIENANLAKVNLHQTRLPNGVRREEYLSDLVPALLTAGGKSLPEIFAIWADSGFENFSISSSFDVSSIAEIPALYRREAQLYHDLSRCRQILKSAVVIPKI